MSILLNVIDKNKFRFYVLGGPNKLDDTLLSDVILIGNTKAIFWKSAVSKEGFK
jgi:hypothetical protein